MYKIKLTKQAKRELKLLKTTELIAISNIFEELKDDPLIGKPLTRELAGRYTYKIGVYRIVYKINDSEKSILILTAGHRSIVYIKK